MDFQMPIKSLQIVFASKSFEDSKSPYETCSSRCELKKQESSQIFVEKGQRYANITVVCLHWQVYWKVVQRRSGKKMGRLICIQCKTISVFCVSASINYRTYASWYLEKMKKFPEEYPQIYKDFQEGKFLVKRNAGYFKLVAPDMKIQD